MIRGRRRSGLSICVLVMMVMEMMSGCAENGAKPVNTMSPREGRDKVVEFVIETTKQLDIQGWWPRSGAASPDVCSLAGGETGASYSYSHWAPEGADFAGDAKKVAAYWESLGMVVRVEDSIPRPMVFGSGGPVLRAVFVTGGVEDSYHVDAEARCAPGDAVGMLREDNAQREAGAVLPGDEGVVLKPRSRQKPATSSPSPSE